MGKKFDAKLQKQVCSLLDSLGRVDERQQDFIIEVLSLHKLGTLEKKLSEFDLYFQKQEREIESDSVAESAYIAYKAARNLIISANNYHGKALKEICDLPLQYQKTIREFSEEMKHAAKTSEDEKKEEYLSASECGFEYFLVAIKLKEEKTVESSKKEHSNRITHYLQGSDSKGSFEEESKPKDQLIERLNKISEEITRSKEELILLESRRKKNKKTDHYRREKEELRSNINMHEREFHTVVGEYLGKIVPEQRALARNFILDYFGSRLN